MDKRQIQSCTIDWLRFPMVALVVLAHSAALGVNSSHEVYATLSIGFGRAICRIPVRCFFLISGYLFFSKLENGWNTDIWLGKLKKRIRTLLLPYIIWNILAAVLIWGYRWLFAQTHGNPYPDFISHIREWGGLWDDRAVLPYDGPMWFVRYLMIYAVAAPAIWAFIKYLRLYGLIALTVVWVAVGHVPEGLVFFAAGAWFRINGRNMVETFRSLRWPALILWLLTWIAIIITYQPRPEYYQVLSKLYFLSGVMVVFLLGARGIEQEKLKLNPSLTKTTFFVYATHNILILHDFSHWIILHTLPFQGEWMECTDLFLRPAIAVLICLGLYWILEKTVPKTLAVLTGGR